MISLFPLQKTCFGAIECKVPKKDSKLGFLFQKADDIETNKMREYHNNQTQRVYQRTKSWLPKLLDLDTKRGKIKSD